MVHDQVRFGLNWHTVPEVEVATGLPRDGRLLRTGKWLEIF